MNVKEGKKGMYSVESTSRKGLWYSVDPKKPWCECPAYKFKYMRSNALCKHIKAAREYIENMQQETLGGSDKTAEVLEFVESSGGLVDSVALIEKFGEDTVDSLIEQGEIVERQGKITILK